MDVDGDVGDVGELGEEGFERRPLHRRHDSIVDFREHDEERTDVRVRHGVRVFGAAEEELDCDLPVVVIGLRRSERAPMIYVVVVPSARRRRYTR